MAESAAAELAGFSVEALHPTFGARVIGLDLAQPLDDDTFGALSDAFGHYGLLVLPDQSLSMEQQLAFSRRFGALEAFPEEAVQKARPEFYNISNVDDAGRLVGGDSVQMRLLQFNALWHTDSSYRTIPAYASILYAIEVPDEAEPGGQTEWADMFAAYDALPDDLRRRMAGRHMVHSPEFDRTLDTSLPPFPNEKKWGLPPVTHPVIRYHPERKRCSVYVSMNVGAEIGGMELEAGRAFHKEIVEAVTQPRFVHRHQWRVGDVGMWDNRRLLHRAIPYDVDRQRRVMRRTTVASTEPVIGPWMIDANSEAG